MHNGRRTWSRAGLVPREAQRPSCDDSFETGRRKAVPRRQAARRADEKATRLRPGPAPTRAPPEKAMGASTARRAAGVSRMARTHCAIAGRESQPARLGAATQGACCWPLCAAPGTRRARMPAMAAAPSFLSCWPVQLARSASQQADRLAGPCAGARLRPRGLRAATPKGQWQHRRPRRRPRPRARGTALRGTRRARARCRAQGAAAAAAACRPQSSADQSPGTPAMGILVWLCRQSAPAALLDAAALGRPTRDGAAAFPRPR